MKLLIGLAVPLVLLFSNCSKAVVDPENDLIISEEERSMMEACQDDAYSTVDQIERNLLGEWRLIGYGCGFCAPHTPPSIQLYFAQNGTGVLRSRHDQDPEEMLDFTWEIDEGALGLTKFGANFIRSEPNDYRISATVMCDRYMWFDITAVDGHMFLYAKQ
ncbi:MAG: hypothetical protein KTR24_18400 [Saprospiraceae bacterium]|nr:hypothetical protein [Saprospiraceae bacterium]